jgi:hypothetical protein
MILILYPASKNDSVTVERVADCCSPCYRHTADRHGPKLIVTGERLLWSFGDGQMMKYG